MTFASACWRSYSATGNVLVKDSMRIFHFSSDMLGVGEGIEMMGYVTACISGLVQGAGLVSLKKFRSLRIGRTHETSVP